MYVCIYLSCVYIYIYTHGHTSLESEKLGPCHDHLSPSASSMQALSYSEYGHKAWPDLCPVVLAPSASPAPTPPAPSVPSAPAEPSAPPVTVGPSVKIFTNEH